MINVVATGAGEFGPQPGQDRCCEGCGPRTSRVRVPSVKTAAVIDLLEGCRSGDELCWAEVVARYEPLVFNVARRNGLTPSDAADATQFAFSKLLHEINSLRDGDRLASWLSTVTRRASWRIGQKRRSEGPHQSVEVGGTGDATSDLAAHWEVREAIAEALAEIGSPCREVIYWLFLDQSSPSHAEISARLGRAIGGVGSLRTRCIEKLRPLLLEFSNDF